MTNYEFYKEKIKEIEKDSTMALLNNELISCKATHCANCQLTNGTGCSVVKFMDWAMTEHKESKINLPEGITVDAPILVSNDGEIWETRHFAKFGDISTVGAWSCGKTSYTAHNGYDIHYWNYAKLPEEQK